MSYNFYMKKIFLLFFVIFMGCQNITPPISFMYKEIKTDTYTLASWQKILDRGAPIRIYIEGDGNAFNNAGQPTTNPTPRGTFLRKIAFDDPNPNVIYLARPCQYVKDARCHQKDWTTGRFSQEIVDSTTQTIKSIIKNISNKSPVILIGYSGGALLSGLVISQNPQIPVKRWMTLAGVFNHGKWTQDLKLPPLKDSVDLEKMPTVPQLHLTGNKDKIVSYQLTESLVDKKNLIIVPNATHDSGYENYYSTIYADE